jgi:hypothetical protein
LEVGVTIMLADDDPLLHMYDAAPKACRVVL